MTEPVSLFQFYSIEEKFVQLSKPLALAYQKKWQGLFSFTTVTKEKENMGLAHFLGLSQVKQLLACQHLSCSRAFITENSTQPLLLLKFPKVC